MIGVVVFANDPRNRYAVLVESNHYTIFRTLEEKRLGIGERVSGDLETLGEGTLATIANGRIWVVIENSSLSRELAATWVG